MFQKCIALENRRFSVHRKQSLQTLSKSSKKSLIFLGVRKCKAFSKIQRILTRQKLRFCMLRVCAPKIPSNSSNLGQKKSEIFSCFEFLRDFYSIFENLQKSKIFGVQKILRIFFNLNYTSKF
jgi:hypothetical protein